MHLNTILWYFFKLIHLWLSCVVACMISSGHQDTSIQDSNNAHTWRPFSLHVIEYFEVWIHHQLTSSSPLCWIHLKWHVHITKHYFRIYNNTFYIPSGSDTYTTSTSNRFIEIQTLLRHGSVVHPASGVVIGSTKKCPLAAGVGRFARVFMKIFYLIRCHTNISCGRQWFCIWNKINSSEGTSHLSVIFKLLINICVGMSCTT
jgi:hypothetical protein